MIMRLRRFTAKAKLFAAVLVVFLITAVIYTQSTGELYNNHEKIIIIERSISSPLNRGVCNIPELPINNTEIMKFYRPVKKINCGNPLGDWVTCEKSICYVKPEIHAMHGGDVFCSYTDVIRKTDFRIKYGKTTKTKDPYVLRESDFVKVACHASDSGQSWFGLAHGIRDTVRYGVAAKQPDFANQFAESDVESKQPFNVLMFGFDSLSRSAYQRSLPKTYDYLTQKLKAIVLTGYNIVGDGTPQALIPLLTGYTELELPETRRRMRNSNMVDVYPFVWQEYAKHGYVTSFNEDLPNVGTFTYRLNGFEKQPVDHYMRTYYVEAANILSGSRANCIGNKPDHIAMMEYTRNFMEKYSDSPRFVFSFHGGLSHDSINLVAAADHDVVALLHSLQIKKLLNNTILIMMADHGNRFSDIRATLQGKQEERLPFFSFAFPDSFQKRFPQQFANFQANANRLTTPFDVHATLIDLLNLQFASMPKPKIDYVDYSVNVDMSKKPLVTPLAGERAISLFNVISENRSCADAYIEPHWCACLRWKPLDVENKQNSRLLVELADSIVAAINSATYTFRVNCEQLELEKINWAMRLLPNEELLQFKSSNDRDGYLADLTGNTAWNTEIYQLQIVTIPGESLFEASVTYNLQTQTATTKLSDISRINKYGSQAACIYDRNPELRKYCYCVDQEENLFEANF